jgi:transposase
MRQASKRIPDSAEKTVRDIRRATRRHHSAEDKIRIVLEGLRGEDSIAELCRKEGINQNLYYRWSKEFLEAGKSGWLATRRERRPRTRSRIPSDHGAGQDCHACQARHFVVRCRETGTRRCCTPWYPRASIKPPTSGPAIAPRRATPKAHPEPVARMRADRLDLKAP